MRDRWFDLLLLFYPRRVRHRFGIGMRDALAHDHADARTRRTLGVATFLSLTCVDAACHGLAERRPGRQGGLSMSALFTVDLRDALRSLRASPVLTLVAVVSLALGIGANAALFSSLNGLFLKTLPVRDPAGLVVIDGGSWTNPIWEQIRERRRDLFEDAFAWSSTRMNLAARGETDFVEGAWASGGMVGVLGVQAARGSQFTE